MRAALDELAQHVPLMSAGDSAAMGEAAEGEAVRLSIAVEGELDQRFVQLCCPQLNQALQVLLQNNCDLDTHLLDDCSGSGLRCLICGGRSGRQCFLASAIELFWIFLAMRAGWSVRRAKGGTQERAEKDQADRASPFNWLGPQSSCA